MRAARVIAMGAAVGVALSPVAALGAGRAQSTASSTSTPTTAAVATTVASTSTSAGTSTTGASTSTTGATSTTGSSSTVAGSSTTLPGSSSTSSTSPGSTLPATTTTAPFVPGPTLKRGSKGDAVLNLERRLAELRYDVGDVDGKYDLQTWEAVVAFQKVEGLKRTGVFNAETQVAMQTAVSPSGLIPSGGLPRVEVDISRQVLMYFDDNGLSRVSAISTGSGRHYCDVSKKSQRQVCGDARTPRGNFKIQRRIKGDRESDLGHLYNPVYFSGGFAVHGSPSVPGYPASHGCVRVTNQTADWFFATVKNGTPIYLYD